MGELPCYHVSSSRNRLYERQDHDRLTKLIPEKINKVRRLLYTGPGETKSEIDVFQVPKGNDDIRFVYNGTSCGLNNVLWSPWFTLPTCGTHLLSVEAGTFLGDVDVGDCWHNFMLHPIIQERVGVNYKNLIFRKKN